MLWYKTGDIKKISELREKYNEEILIFPTKEEILSFVKRGVLPKVVSSQDPPGEVKNMFIVKDLDGIFTSQEEDYLNSLPEKERDKEEKRLIEKKTGVKIYKTKMTFKDVVGLKGLRERIEILKQLEPSSPLFPKAFMGVGIPGTGKSLSVKAMSGELDRYIIEMNLGKILETENPLENFDKILDYLEETRLPCILWIDEIEKAIADPKGKKIIGRLLTVLQEWHSPIGYQIDGFWWITANDIVELQSKHPEFFRSGRLSGVFFMDFPSEEKAKAIFELYVNKWIKTPLKIKDRKKEEVVKLYLKYFKPILKELFVVITLGKLKKETLEKSIFADRSDAFVFVPAEIEEVTKLLVADLALTPFPESIEQILFKIKNKEENFPNFKFDLTSLTQDKDFRREVSSLAFGYSDYSFKAFLQNHSSSFYPLDVEEIGRVFKHARDVIERNISKIKPIALSPNMEEGLKKMMSQKEDFISMD